jgi:hypothetical protein
MRVISKNKVAVFFGLLMCGSLALAQNFQPGGNSRDYRPVGALIFRDNNSTQQNEPRRVPEHVGYVLYVSILQDALLDPNPASLEEQAEMLEIPSEDVERVYLLLNELNKRFSSSRRSILEEECAPLLAGRSLGIAEVQAAVARIDADEPREEILQSVLQNVRDIFGDDVVSRMQTRVDRINKAPQHSRIWELEQTMRARSGGDAGYLNEQCAALQE